MTDGPAPTPTEDPEEAATRSARGRLLWAAATGLAVIAVAALLIVGLSNRGASRTLDKAIDRGDRAAAPDFTLPLLIPGAPLDLKEGTEVTLSSLRGKPVVLNMWASWCEPCRDEAPLLNGLYSQYTSRGVVMLGVNVQDITEDARRFAAGNNLHFPSVRDGNDEVKGDYGATAFPETFIIDREGRVAWLLRGPLTDDAELENVSAFKAALEKVIAEPATTTGAGAE